MKQVLCKPQDRSWQRQAACRGVSLEVFFPESVGRGEKPYEEAKQICSACEVKQECLMEALWHERHQHTVVHGFVGGMPPDQRRRYATRHFVAPDRWNTANERKSRVVSCCDCGTRFRSAASNAVRCADCRPLARQRRNQAALESS